MAEGNTVDTLEIEIEAPSSEAEKKVSALADALKRLKKESAGFGNISEQIRGVGEAAEDAGAQTKVRRKKEALDRAAGSVNPASASGVDADKAGEKIESVNQKIEKAQANISELNEQIRMLGFAHDKEQGAQMIEQLNQQLREQQGILDGLIRQREHLSAVAVNAVHAAEKTQRPEDPWANVKAQLKGSTLGDLVGDAKSIDEAVSRMAELNDQAAILNVKLDGLQEKLRGAFEKGNQSQVATYTAQIQKLKEQLAQLQDEAGQAQDSGTELVESETSLEKKVNLLLRLKDHIVDATGAADGLKNVLSDIVKTKLGGIEKNVTALIPKGAQSSVSALGGAFEGLTSKALGFVAAHPVIAAALGGVVLAAKKIGGEMKKLGQSAFSAAKKGLEAVANAARNLAASLKDLLRSGLNKIGAGLKSIGQGLVSRFTRPFKNALDAFAKWKSVIGRIAFYRAVREAIKAVTDGFKIGIENLYQYSKLVGTQFAPAMNSLATSALYLKNSLGAMAAPLIQAVAPAIDFLIDKFVALINVIGKAFAMLTGKSVYTQAKKHAVEYGDAANAAANATQKFLLGIDELTILDNPAGGGGGAASDFGSMFEEVEIDQDQFDWVRQIREAIENGEWRSVGELVAEKLNKVVDAWDSYAWGEKLGTLINNGLNVAYGFLDKFDFENLGSKVADGLNGIFDTVDWDLLGRTFAAEWNALFDFIYGFATTLKWHEIGLDIARAINGFLDELDATRAAEAVSKFITGLFDTISTAIAETNWGVLGAKLAEFLNNVDWYGAIYGALSIITNGLAALKQAIDSFLQDWNWEDMARQIYTAINDAFSDVDWKGLGETLGDFFKTAFDFLRETIAGIKWEEIGKDVSEFISGINWDEVVSSFLNLAKTLIDSAITGVKSFLDNTPTEVLAKITEIIGAVALGAIAAMTKNKKVIIAEGLLIIAGIFNEFGDKIKEVVGQLAQKINQFIEKTDWKKMGKYISDGIKNALEAAIIFVQELDWAEVGRAIVDLLLGIDWVGLLSDLGLFIGETLTGVLIAIFSDLPGLLEVGGKIVLGIFEGIISAIPFIGPWINENLFGPLNEALGTGYSEVEEVTHEKTKGIVDRTAVDLGEMSTVANEAVSDMNTEMGISLDAVAGTVSGAWNAINIDTDNEWGFIKNNLDTTWGGINTNADTQFGEVKKTITSAFSETNTETGRLMGELKDEVHGKSEEIQTQAGIDFEGVADSIRRPMEDVIKEATGWGEDICKSLAAGMQGVAKGAVAGAATALAQSIRDRVHFSEPDVGPLSDFHTYMPDMLKLMASGIRDNSYLAVNAANDLADSMSRAMGNIEPVEPKLSAHEDFFASIQPVYGGANADSINVSGQGDQDANNSDIINAMLAMGQQVGQMIVNAINENGDRPISIDWAKAAAQTTAMQNRRNMMYGKSLQNT